MFTEPDFANENLEISYDIRYSMSYGVIMDHFETLTNKWVHNKRFGSSWNAMSNFITINITEEPSLIGKVIFVGIVPIVEGVSCRLSNIVRVSIPKTPRSINNLSFNEEVTDSSVDYSFEDKEVFNGGQKLAGVKIELFIAAVACILLVLILVVFIICCRRKTNQKTKKCKSTSISVTQSSGSFATGYVPEPVSNYPDHLTIGLPAVYEENCHDQLFEEMKHQSNFHHETYGSNNLQANDANLRWASYLLQEHEKIHNPLDSSMYVEHSNGDICPEIPDLPVFDNSYYGYVQNPPPNYTSYKPLGSMQSVNDTISSDKKIRNITMV